MPPLRFSIPPANTDLFFPSHCDACKLLSGSENTLNTVANKDDLKVTKGSPKTYTYHGDSGTVPNAQPWASIPLPYLPTNLHNPSNVV